MRGVFLRFAAVSVAAMVCGCDGLHGGGAVSAEDQQAVTDGVRAFMRGVADDVTKDGPTAWRAHFEDNPAFFMAVNGKLEFADSRSATEGIQNVARMFKQIELHWGDEIRVDPLTPRFGVVASTYRELITMADGQQITSIGFFSAVAENQNGRWQFRDVHWSVPVAVPATAAKPGGS